ncbi:mannosyltransferase [Aspergillus nanangensis]|uniref:Chitobiosyldiphosphodolichol beta-mannosyltransferase n=1 Tax=Aspergillus nanangensis TaxID=2582783 RepID=A0AAD4CR01_ASPNN|nr:mannosyltransferase [Aspergillus nanangensis]
MIESLISVAFYISTALTIFILLLPSQYSPKRIPSQDAPNPKTTVQVLVLGDIGRSPRMQYHALSIAKGGGTVDIIGYNESEVHPDISSDSRITIVPLPPHPSYLQTSNKILFLLVGPLKVLFQVACLWYNPGSIQSVLISKHANTCNCVIRTQQNPPSIPTLAIASLVSFFRQTHLVIDWHNFGYTILALKLGDHHPLVKFSKWYEKTFCRYATAHICVTTAMASVLKKEFRLKAPILPLHDRPASHLKPISDDKERREFLASLSETESVRPLISSGSLRVLVSPTSWTADEDFSLLIDALCRYSELATTKLTQLPTVLAIITGKGPQKEMYINQIHRLEKAGKLQKVIVRTAWLSTNDYARLLASASLGVSLHTSSSGVDLPMKVVDMFGAGLPVVGWDRFEAWPELVTEGINGKGFGSVDELVNHVVDLFGDSGKLDTLRAGALEESTRRWDDEWEPIAGKLLGLV